MPRGYASRRANSRRGPLTIFRAQIGFQLDSTLPKDMVCITPHYVGTDASGLANQLKTNLIANVNVGASTPFVVKIYDAQHAKPNPPLATATNGSGSIASATVRELALCLSYYATTNAKRRRGRLYIPSAFLGSGATLRPTTTQQNNALAWKGTLTTSLPSGTNWVVFSRMDNAAYTVTNVYVNDEWDIVRSRGLRETSRVTGTVP
jgi:hypothetical protein